jgi:hypothetical protein
MNQTSMFVRHELPPEFEAAFVECERNGRSITYAIDSVIYEKGKITVAIRVNGKRCAVLFRDDVFTAARDLYTQAVRRLDAK